ncbi:MAG TPA: flagellar basal body rod protein FlgC [Acidiferrobacteraceae bacterium]|nr:flagellar basal body rod protein FlgC [Acidiferrobacteraceae bacterium]
MSLFNVFSIAGSAMSANSLRLNVTASNLANAESVSSSINTTYRARHPVFSAVFNPDRMDGVSTGVATLGVVESAAPLQKQHQPDHPMADAKGYIYMSNVNSIEEMANMLAASRAYENNVEVLNTSKQLLIRTLSLGQG